MFRLLFSKNSGHGSPLQQTLLAFSAAILLTGILSCSSSSPNSQGHADSASGNAAAPANNTGAKTELVGDQLYVYFLENSAANPRLRELLNEGRNHKKIVLQLHREKDGTLSLTAWPGKEGNAEFQVADKVELKRGSLASGVSLKDKSVYLGNTEIGPKKANDLRNLPYTPENRFILFFPKIAFIDAEKIPHLVYVVQMASDSIETAPKANLLPDVISFDTNPSPPRPVDSN